MSSSPFIFGVILFSLLSSSLTAENPSLPTLRANDIDTLNYALTLERLGSAFYTHFLGSIFNESSFSSWGGATTYNYLLLIQAHEQAHVLTLTNLVKSFQGVLAAPCQYNFSSVSNVSDFLALATLFENLDASAYDGAVNTVYHKSVIKTLATIASVEAQQAAFLQFVSTINSTNNPAGSARAFPFGNFTLGGNGDAAFESTVTPSQAVNYVFSQGLITHCASNLTLPLVLTINASQPLLGALQNNLTALEENDLAALNFALTLEHLESTLYNSYQPIFNASDFENVGLDPVYDFATFNLIRDHENAHVVFLTNTILSLGGTPVQACTYNFGTLNNVVGTNISSNSSDPNERRLALLSYISLARFLETLGTSAYDGALNTLTNQVLIQATSTIATIEARHSAYLSYVTGVIDVNGVERFTDKGNPFPSSFDRAIPPAAVLQIISGFIVNCSSPLAAPQVIFLVPTNGTFTPPPTNITAPHPNTTTTNHTHPTTTTSSSTSITSTTSGTITTSSTTALPSSPSPITTGSSSTSTTSSSSSALHICLLLLCVSIAASVF